jgi:hypothetical protein
LTGVFLWPAVVLQAILTAFLARDVMRLASVRKQNRDVFGAEVVRIADKLEQYGLSTDERCLAFGARVGLPFR